MPLAHIEDIFGAVSMGNEAYSWSTRQRGVSMQCLRVLIWPVSESFALDEEELAL